MNNNTTLANAQANPAFIRQQKLERLWHASLVQLSRGPEISFPAEIRRFIGNDGIRILANRYSALTGNQAQVFEDRANNAIRIFMPEPENLPLHPALQNIQDTSTYTLSPSPNSVVMTGPDGTPQRLGRHGRAGRVPRPPNAFILYRRHHHPIVKANNPNICNNDISIILGSQWRYEKPEIKAEFFALADILKCKHHETHPNYQYQPRKASEKKRRMTRRKAAALKNTGNSAEGGPAHASTSDPTTTPVVPVADCTHELPATIADTPPEQNEHWIFPATQEEFDSAFVQHLEILREVPTEDQLVPAFKVNKSANLEINFPLDEEALNNFLLDWNVANASAPPLSDDASRIQSVAPAALSSVLSERCIEDEQFFTNTASWDQVERDALRQAEELAKAFKSDMFDDGLHLAEAHSDSECRRMQSLL
ncbi:hypothetical protein L228DRAFT_285192 [Xylona heveae TC161]|uniref:HMG box domain-containing protein n=1 Tax=Xylona heveae (strain CBS 132557 / TC161) TaxID=1328760 RepID=A0A165AHQ1_XYLHT|nr:hypothetical protein L228DRAFT_285192 [Xylona heveae TC161]KZF20493.1 hypothetical protein L228DRAFT_285192 [Xylona heveae TC161]